jgi:HEAT repeat protein
MRKVLGLTVVACVLSSSAFLLAADDPDERALKQAGVATDGAGLLDYFRKRGKDEVGPDKIAALIKQLGDDSFDRREGASAQLVAIGPRAEEQLRGAVKSPPDAEVKRRAELCLQQIAKGGTSAVPAAAARLLGKRKPDGAAAALLDYLPNANGASAAEAARAALAAVAQRDGKPEPALLKALEDKSDLKREAAAVALARGGGKEALPAVRRLLKAPEAAVRLRVALALAYAHDKEAVPALIGLLAELPQEQGVEAEELLRDIAGDAAPKEAVGESEASHKAARDAWLAWWKKSGDKVDLTKLSEGPRYLGYTLIVRLDSPAAGAKVGVRLAAPAGRVTEYDTAGKVRWEIDGLKSPREAQMLPNGNVFIFEYTGRLLTERTTKGEVVWEKTVPGRNRVIYGTQRLADGNVFIALAGALLEIDKDGREVFNYEATSPVAARKLPTGEMAYVTMAGRCVHLDKDGKETASFDVGRISTTGGVDFLPNGNVLVALPAQNRVAEFDRDGKPVWSATAEKPYCVTRLRNGNTLVCCTDSQYVIELDRDGKEVGKQTLTDRPYRASRR